MRSKGISQFYLHTPRSSVNGMNHICLCLPSRSWYSFTDSGGMEGRASRVQTIDIILNVLLEDLQMTTSKPENGRPVWEIACR